MPALRTPLLLSCVLLMATPVAADTFELDNGDKVSGTVVERNDERIVLESPIFGRIEFPVAELKKPKPPNPGLFGTSWLEGWTRTFSLGFSGQQGNSDTADVTVALDADFEDDTRRWAFDARYNFSTAEGSTTQNNAMLGLGRDFLFHDSRWFAFARGRFDFDDFRTWKFRIQGDGGVGYEFVKRETFELRGRFGPSLVHEWDEDQFRAEALIGPQVVWKLGANQRIEASNYFYYAFTPWADFRNVTDVKWRWNLMEKPALSLQAGASRSVTVAN